ncbi:hypothetical protein [Streptomyces sp. NPDC055400]
MLTVALPLCDQELSLREIAERLVISTGKKKSQHPSAATVMRMLRDHDERALEASDQGQLLCPWPWLQDFEAVTGRGPSTRTGPRARRLSAWNSLPSGEWPTRVNHGPLTHANVPVSQPFHPQVKRAVNCCDELFRYAEPASTGEP